VHEEAELSVGLYDHLLTAAMEARCSTFADPRLCSIAKIDSEDAHAAVAQYLEHLIAGALGTIRGSELAERRQRVIQRLLELLGEEFGEDWSERLRAANPLRRLLAVHAAHDSHAVRPDTALSRSALLTGARVDPSLGGQLGKEIASADRIDVICSFIRWSGLRIILDSLRKLTESPSAMGDGPRLRVITTSYMGATDPRAIDALLELPNTEIRVSYDTERTRLHAKAYLIHRRTGFGSAYVGSANLSHAALSEGLEWTTKLSQYELPYLWAKLNATFETYWRDDEFERYSEATRHKLREAIGHERRTSGSEGVAITFDLRPWPFQEEILDILSAERSIQGKNRHLVVAATGTGKTMIAAFDYLRWTRTIGETGNLLFVAHREEILRQALGTFRAVLRDQNFGDLLVGGFQPEQTRHLFCSIQSFNAQELWRTAADHYRYVVIDEFHHAAAPSYQRLLNSVLPAVLLGLTATPERTDQLDILGWFGGSVSAEIRLPDAINRRLLCPFQYFGVSDSVDLDALTWQRGGYRVEELDSVYTGNDARAALVLGKTSEIVLDTKRARGLGFCVSVAHAEYMARFFREHGVPALAVSGGTADDERHSVQQRLRSRDVNFVFVVDLYNEGVDIPEVDTLLFLRPTESLMIFLQQLGRGLRLHDDKDCLTVIDFIGAHRREFRFAPRFRALSADPLLRVDHEIEAGFPHLPSGCIVHLERVAQARVLENVRSSLRLNRPRMVSDVRDLGRQLGRAPTLDEATQYLDTSADELLKRACARDSWRMRA
jgi:superfamily II DNA or RNA helicase